MDLVEFPDFYQLLGVESNASVSVIKKRYHQLSLLHHPDKKDSPNNDFVQINSAYKVLSQMSLKQQYDLQYVAYKNQMSVAINDQIPLEEMTAEETLLKYSCRCGGDYTVMKETIQLPVPAICVNCDTCSLCIQVVL